MKPPIIRILIVDSQPLVRRAWRALFAAHSDFEVVAEADNLTEACEQATEKSPDVITVDFEVGRESGLELLSRLEQRRSNGDQVAKVMILTRHEDAGHVQAALAARVSGYVATSATEDELVEAIRAIHAGRFVLRAVLGPALSEVVRSEALASPLNQLSKREREVLQGLAEGHTNKAIAARMELSVKTVETYRSRLCIKLKLRTRAELVPFAIRHGLLSISPFISDEAAPSLDR